MPVMAQEPVARPQEIRGEFRKEVRDLRENVKGEVRDLREGLKEEVSRIKESVKPEDRRTLVVPHILERKEALRDTVKLKRDELKVKIDGERAELKVKLAKIKDARKRVAVEKIQNQIKELNEKMLNHFSDVLEKLRKTLIRIDERIAKAKDRGVDVAEPMRLSEEARKAIIEAEEAIKAQAAKTYPLSITDEGKLKEDIGRVRKVLHDDLDAVKVSVKAAREAVHKVAVALAKVPKSDDNRRGPATTTPATTTSSN